jgi:casein kinase 1 alpha
LSISKSFIPSTSTQKLSATRTNSNLILSDLPKFGEIGNSNNNSNINIKESSNQQSMVGLNGRGGNTSIINNQSIKNRVNSMCSQNPGMQAFQNSILNQQLHNSSNNLNAGSQKNLNLISTADKTYNSKTNKSHASKMGTTGGASGQRTGITLAGNYKLFYKIGSGSFGEIYLALNLKTNAEVAVKVEPMSSRPQSLPYEAKVYQRIQSGEGIPKIHYFGAERSRDIHVLVMDLLGPSLEDLFKFCGRKLSYKTTIMLADQMISRVEWLHSKNLIHRDIKPDNFIMGIGSHCNTVFLADYGLAKRYRNSVGKHIKYRDDKSLTGTARYASVNTHYGSEQSRRDDLESLGYVLVYFMKGKLPWQNLKTKDRTKNRYEAIAEKKLTTSIPTLCYGCPSEFQMFLQYCRGLKFDESPDYNYLRQLFQVLLNSMGYEMDNVYDWTNIMDQAMKKKENSISSGYASSESQEKKGNTTGINKGKSAYNGLSITGGLKMDNNLLNVHDPYESRKSIDHKSAYKDTSSKGWLRFPFNALKFRKSGKSKAADGYTDKSYGKNCKASMRTGLTDRDDDGGTNLFSPISIGRQKSCRSTNVDTTSKGILRGKMRRSFFLSMSSSKTKSHHNVKSSSHSVKNHF